MELHGARCVSDAEFMGAQKEISLSAAREIGDGFVKKMVSGVVLGV